MTAFVRVKDTQTGNHFTVAEGTRYLRDDRYQVVDLPALDKSGRPRAAKYPVPKTSPASGGGQATKAATTEAKKEAKES